MGNSCTHSSSVFEPDDVPALSPMASGPSITQPTPGAPQHRSPHPSPMQGVTKTGMNQQTLAQRVLEGDIKFVGLLGTGAYGRVYKAIWNSAEVAVKVVMQNSSGGSNEAALSQQLRHPNVVGTYIYTTREADGDPLEDDAPTSVIVMEFCDRGGLTKAVSEGLFHPNDTPNMILILLTLRDVSAGLGYLHSVGVVHADLNMNNVLLSSTSGARDPRKFVAKVADFGLSRIFNNWSATHKSTRNYGTITHVPPELLADGKLTPSGDVYAFGVLMYELYTRDKPYDGMHYGQVVTAVVAGERPIFPDTCPKKYVSLAASCWHDAKNKRPGWSEIQKQIANMLDEFPPGLDDDVVDDSSLV